jgi:hypothetical protein
MNFTKFDEFIWLVMEKIFFKMQCIFTASYSLPLEKDVLLHLKKLEPLTPGMMCVMSD